MNLSLEEKRIKIAEKCGWTKCRLAIKGAGGGTRWPTAHGVPPNRNYEAPCPDYFSDLNAMHGAKKLLYVDDETEEQAQRRVLFELLLCDVVEHPLNATAAQQAEAFGIAFHLWPYTKTPCPPYEPRRNQ